MNTGFHNVGFDSVGVDSESLQSYGLRLQTAARRGDARTTRPAGARTHRLRDLVQRRSA